MFPEPLLQEATAILERFRKKGLKLATAESCTGGMLSTLLTEIPGSSNVFEGGFITYSNALKQSTFGVKAESLKQHGAVSAEVAQEMAAGVKRLTGADIAISITGVAGPGGSEQKPAGLVYLAVAHGTSIYVDKQQFSGTRHEVRVKTVVRALELLSDTLTRSSAAFA